MKTFKAIRHFIYKTLMLIALLCGLAFIVALVTGLIGSFISPFSDFVIACAKVMLYSALIGMIPFWICYSHELDKEGGVNWGRRPPWWP